ncbi:MAG: hypothetical protein M3345_04535 [Actinomycetota bacterium]|nr:hypothetical protein [Actinomycetota bacterium]
MSIGDDSESGEGGTEPRTGVTYRRENVRCGKEGCKSCPHGPYWYAYYRVEGRLRSRYIGRDLPADVKTAIGPETLED